ncbi:DUF6620 family protein [Parapedobacter lycopersici]|uniref:DUF6620 family protein n=1 Tax=Parapedobacter lycopersici TaxID=1864939 RepID=UPI00333E4F5E
MFKKMFKNLTDNLMNQKNEAGEHGESFVDQIKNAMAGQVVQHHFDAGAASVGMTTMNTAKEDPNDPLLQPIHGVSIADYAAGMLKIGEGVSADQIAAALGVEGPMWDEARTLWESRMKEDGSFNVINVYTKYYGEAKTHEKLGNLVSDQPATSNIPAAESNANLQKATDDKYFFFELQGALQAAYDNGMDGAQWLVDTYGFNVSQLNSAGVKWMSNMGVMMQMIDHQDKKQKEYSEKFARDLGGNIADDVEF